MIAKVQLSNSLWKQLTAFVSEDTKKGYETM
jgi:hypothetical protein